MAKRVRRAQPPPPQPENLLERILSAPHLARAVPQLPPEVLHRVIQQCGLADCADLMTLATPGQLARVFDLDLWRPVAPGLDEQFDARRFASGSRPCSTPALRARLRRWRRWTPTFSQWVSPSMFVSSITLPLRRTSRSMAT